MGLCRPARCGCSFDSATLEIAKTADGRVSIEMPDAYASAYPVFTFLNAAERDAELPDGIRQEGMECWTRADDLKWRFTGSAWRIIRQGRTTINPTLGNAVLGSGGVNEMNYWITEETFHFYYTLRLGTGGSLTGFVIVALPIVPASIGGGVRSLGIAGTAYDVSMATMFSLSPELSGVQIVPYRNDGGGGYSITPTNPFAWGPGDELWMWGAILRS